MKDLSIPLISPLSRKYYQYACDNSAKVHHRAEDVRICLEKICDSIVIQLVATNIKSKWKEYKLHDKIEACKKFMDNKVVEGILKAKCIGNTGVHEGEEGDFTQQDIDDSLEAIRNFSLEIFYSFFVKNGFGNSKGDSWVPTVFSTLPPIYRIQILEKYYLIDPSVFVIDKLSKAYLKNNEKEKAYSFLFSCNKKNQIQDVDLYYLMDALKALEPHLDKFSIARNLDDAKKNFLKLLPAIDEKERDTFVILVSIILIGEKPNDNINQSNA